MAFFRKKKTTTNIPELQEYYASQKSQSTGLAWLLALGSLVVTALIIVALFLGGRWTYRKIANRHKSTVAVTGTVSNDSKTESTTNNVPTPTPSTAPETTPPAATAPTPTLAPAAPQGVATTQTPAQNSAATSATTKSSVVPNTGPGDTIQIFVVVVVIAYFAHRSYLLHKTNLK